MNFSDIQPLTTGLPRMVVLSIMQWAPVNRIVEGFIAAGLECHVLSLDDSVSVSSDVSPEVSQHTQCLKTKKINFFQKYKVINAICRRQHPCFAGEYEFSFIDADLGVPLSEHPVFQQAGLVFMGLRHGMFTWGDAPALFRNKACVLFGFNMSVITGYCDYAAGCEKWKTPGCQNCPQLGLKSDGRDMVKKIFEYKKGGFSDLNMAIVTPSCWLKKHVKESPLCGHLTHYTIPTSVRLDLYKPMAPDAARTALGLPLHRPIVLAGAAGSRPNKGFQVLRQALTVLRKKWPEPDPILCCFGSAAGNGPRLINNEYYDFGYIADAKKLAQLYSAADVFVSPAFEDNLPNTVNEALACGTPVICFDEFSSEDVIHDGITGFLVKHPGLPLDAKGNRLRIPPYHLDAEQCVDLAEKIHLLLTMSPECSNAMRRKSREYAEVSFDPVLQAARYLCVYRRLLHLPKVALENDITLL
ncbi:MAG: glycosyltransferase [Desulfovibrio sp.]|uniref:glycosyltransferase n=1 Tax=Desulfovibrio sp. TaxID=885 RepID=UPI0025829869|nr:glycosyltransferase [Desulfovibrio sp.]MCD7985113.1 glycosyltransferase [Desulfovibrio sp.]